jgi:hypothetical protein
VQQQSYFTAGRSKVIEELSAVGRGKKSTRLDLHYDSSLDEQIDSKRPDNDSFVNGFDRGLFLDLQSPSAQFGGERSTID